MEPFLVLAIPLSFGVTSCAVSYQIALVIKGSIAFIVESIIEFANKLKVDWSVFFPAFQLSINNLKGTITSE